MTHVIIIHLYRLTNERESSVSRVPVDLDWSTNHTLKTGLFVNTPNVSSQKRSQELTHGQTSALICRFYQMSFPSEQEPAGGRRAAETGLLPAAASTLEQKLQACPDKAPNSLLHAQHAG